MPKDTMPTILKDLEKTALQLLDNIAKLLKEMDAPPSTPAERRLSIKAEVLKACKAQTDKIFNSYQVYELLKGKYSKKAVFDSLRSLARDGAISKISLMTYKLPSKTRGGHG